MVKRVPFTPSLTERVEGRDQETNHVSLFWKMRIELENELRFLSCLLAKKFLFLLYARTTE